MVDLSDNDLSGHRAEVLAKLLDESPWATRMSLRLDHSRLHDESAVLFLHPIRGCNTLTLLNLGLSSR
ncbi:Leucine-rich repeat-containing protein 16A [Phytophthora cinnamomi]|uniref:Leucine-rich repeat-containing protein 16A n=1 Tax=Phytophthora cinnamomi TaxID=4785 RepID=UPI00355A8D97|nr:Leucine-rich repeat-containing protein 16A [Phytophthora cinnamomi]